MVWMIKNSPTLELDKDARTRDYDGSNVWLIKLIFNVVL